MPVLFIGHGSPMNGIGDNEFSRTRPLLAAVVHPWIERQQRRDFFLQRQSCGQIADHSINIMFS
ncbi:hypothetical protein BC349_09840 [Flavihumibacter stibioxidans]|uniref:Catalytic LigB subunit of aromatic ring-opening dioxygenase n=1 Tax=Flavihumibacter stibioxidans TaxID=1834163 RepID=A0ABR7M9S0_9BACT|nr:hypothetical protein [Flavihumibacter stibioxidans]